MQGEVGSSSLSCTVGSTTHRKKEDYRIITSIIHVLIVTYRDRSADEKGLRVD